MPHNKTPIFSPMRIFVQLAWACLIWGGLPVTPVCAIHPGEFLLPDTTKFSLQISDLQELQTKFNRTQMGHLVNDPLMRPFVDDLQLQIEQRLKDEDIRFGMTWEDIESVAGGEVCLAQIQPDGKKDQHASVVIVDVTGHEQEMKSLWAKIHRDQTDPENLAKYTEEKIPGTETLLKIYTQKLREDDKQAEINFYFLHENQLVATDHKGVSTGIRRRMQGNHQEILGNVEAYVGSMQGVTKESDGLKPDVRWFIEPFGLIDVLRATQGGRQVRGVDFVQILADTGFKAVQGVGGHINLAEGEREILHRSLIYAPAVERAPGDTDTAKYRDAARMLQFPSTQDLFPQAWIPRELASFISVNWKTRDAATYVEPIVDTWLGGADGEGTYEDIKISLRDDESGPQIDIDKAFFSHLGDQLLWLTDYEAPSSPTCERVMLAMKITDPEQLQATIRKIMDSDQNATEHVKHGLVVWEVVEEETEQVASPEVDGLNVFGFGDELEDEFEDDEEPLEPLFPYKVTTVVHDYLIIATHMELLESVLTSHAATDQLASSADYQLVQKDLEKLGAKMDSLRVFSRTAEEIRPNYELIRQGTMPKSKTLLGKFLNRIISPENGSELREQKIDGSKMPDFQIARRYLGPTGLYMQTREDGWLIVGSLLSEKGLLPDTRIADESVKAP